MEDILNKLTEEQKKILKQYRINLGDILTPEHTDYALVKFLRARNFNLKECQKIFTDNYYNRITFGVNTILDTYEKPEVIQRYETTGILGFAKNGTLIHYVACGRLDFYGFIMSMSCCDICLYFSHMMQYDINLLQEENRRTGKNIQEITYILDLDEFSISQVMHKNVIEMGLDYVRLLQDCYPEIWSHVLIVNAPKAFDKAFKLFKPVIRAAVFEKIKMADKDSTKGLLLKYIDENVLPEFLGGKRVDSNGDPMCKEFITFGGKVPEKFYGINQRIPLSPTDPGVKSIVIPTRSMYNHSVLIHEPMSRIRVQIHSFNGSISISVLYKEFGPDPNNEELPAEDEYIDETAENCKYKQISVEIRGQFHCTQEDAIALAPVPGVYITRISNARNWFTSRRLLLKHEILPPLRNDST